MKAKLTRLPFSFIGDVVSEEFGRGNQEKLASSKDYAIRMKGCRKEPFSVIWNCMEAVEDFLVENLKRSLVVLVIVNLIDDYMV